MNVKDNKLDDDAYYLLTLVLMAKEATTREIPYGAHEVLGVGMPLKQFATVRKQFVKYLMREKQPVHFRYEDQAFEFTIDNVRAFPQCYAAVAEQLSNMTGESLIVDAGSWTNIAFYL
jgi:plasmid segregation protein ParM